VKMLRLLPMSAQESDHVSTRKDHDTHKEGFPEGQQDGKCVPYVVTLG
jgi:hypothetical protein